MSDALLLDVRGLGKEVHNAVERLTILKRVDFTLRPGETAAVVGASGSGKSTLLHILGTLDQPTSGSVYFAGQDTTTLTRAERIDCAMRASASCSSFTICCRNSPRWKTWPCPVSSAGDLMPGPGARPPRCWTWSAWRTAVGTR